MNNISGLAFFLNVDFIPFLLTFIFSMCSQTLIKCLIIINNKSVLIPPTVLTVSSLSLIFKSLTVICLPAWLFVFMFILLEICWDSWIDLVDRLGEPMCLSA